MKQQLVGVAQCLDLLSGKTAALHADNVEPGQPGAVAHDLAIRDDIALHPGHAANHRVAPDPNKLMHGTEPAQERMFLEHDMSGKSGVICHDNVVGDLAVMRDMRSDHKQAVISDTGNHAAAGRARVHRYVFADRIARAD